MAETHEDTPKETDHKEEEEEDQSFEELGVDARLLRALIKKRIEKPTPIQRVAIPLILVTLFFPTSTISIHRSASLSLN